MQFPESWLREFCNPPLTTQQLADKLTMAGLEVEELAPVAPAFSSVVVGEIKACEQHPNADRLRVCQVDVGQAALLNIVCGAPNARVGIKIPCALVGAELPPSADSKDPNVEIRPFKIKLGQLRGVESQGMLCSSKELGIADDANAAAGLLELASDAVVGISIREHLNLDDTLFTLKLTPNLAHCLSVYGVAREVAAITGSPLMAPKFPTVKTDFTDVVPVKIDAPDLCGRFSGRIVRGVNFDATTPAWMVDKLARCGQRSVNALVDISNYVMFELGRPTHIFDLDKIKGGLSVRWGKAGETLKLLNGNTITLDAKVGVIADDTAVESLAGIMGGDATAVSASTKNIYIEAAFWYPSAVAGRSRRFNFSTDAGHRFERGVDPSTTLAHIERITELVLQICGHSDTQVGLLDDHQPNMPRVQNVMLRASRAAKVIGMPLTKSDCRKTLTSLGLQVADDAQNTDALIVTPPAYRFDLQMEEDLIEEVVRTVGYDNLAITKPLAPTSPKLRLENQRSAFAVRRLLAQLGYQETINFSFVPEQWEAELVGNAYPVRLTNPIASQMNVMRSSLMGSLLSVLKYNQDRKTTQELGQTRVFELGRVFLRDEAAVDTDTTVKGLAQPMRVAGLASGDAQPIQWGVKARAVDFFDVRADIEAVFAPRQLTFKPASHPALHPGRSADVYAGEQYVGVLGELHPKWKQSYGLVTSPVLFELDLAAVLARDVPSGRAVPKVPFVQRDLAVVVQESVTHASLMAAIESAKQSLVQSAILFDVYRAKTGDTSMAPDEKSLAVRLTLGDLGATLTDAQIDTTIAAVLQALETQLNAKLR